MSRGPGTRLRDILAACETIETYLRRADPDDGMLYDAIRVRLIEIGEAVKGMPSELLDTEPSIPWKEIVRMRDALSHRYFDTSRSIVKATAADDVPELAASARRMLQRVRPEDDELE